MKIWKKMWVGVFSEHSVLLFIPGVYPLPKLLEKNLPKSNSQSDVIRSALSDWVIVVTIPSVCLSASFVCDAVYALTYKTFP